MRFTLDDPRWLALLILLVPTIVLGARWLLGMTPVRRWSAILFRGALLAIIAVLLAGASSVRESSRVAVVGVIDVSSSVRLFGQGRRTADGRPLDAIDAARAFFEDASKNRGVDALAGVVAFDGRALAVVTPTSGELAGRWIERTGSDGSDIAAALRYAAALMPPDASGRIVLMSDGNQTSGDALEAARELAARVGGGSTSLPVDVVPIELEAAREVIVESVDVPPRAASEATVNVRVALRATAPARGTLRLLLNGSPVEIDGRAGRTLELAAGRTVEVMPVRLPPGRIQDFRAVWEPEAGADGVATTDTRAENNVARAFTITPGRGSVLIVDPDAARANSASLAEVLREGNIDVTTVPPEAMPTSPLELQAFDLVMLANVPAEAVSDASQRALEASVRDLGLGLVMLGGPDSFGAGGWKGSRIEPLLPVRLDLPDKVVLPSAAVVLVIDNSGSMNRGVMGSALNKQEIANQAAALAIRTLDARDLIGVIVFNNDYDVLLPLAPNSDPRRSSDRVLGVSAGGGTNAGPAMEEALRQLQDADAAIKHMIVISDGVSQRSDQIPSIAQRAWTQHRVMVSTIGVGDEMDEVVMAAAAASGGGKFYPVTDPTLLPRFLLKAVRVVRSPLIRLGDFTPAIVSAASPLLAGVLSAGDAPPPLGGLVLTQPRPEPTITLAMRHPSGEPVLAHWVYSLGQVAAFTSDASTWAGQWLAWPGYRQFWTTLARTLARPSTSSGFDLAASVVGDRVQLRLDASAEGDRPLDGLTTPATLYPVDSSLPPIELTLQQTAPGTYEAQSGTLPAGNYVVTVMPRSGERRLTPVVGGLSIAEAAEFRELRTNRALLRQIASTTGGRVLDIDDPRAANLFDRAGMRPTTRREPLTSLLLVAAIAVLLLDVATRRIAWDRFVSTEFGGGLAERAREAVKDRATPAAQAADRLKGRSESVRARPVAKPDAGALTDEDAERIIREQRERRLAERIRAARESTRAEDPQEPVDPVATSENAPVPAPSTPPAAEPSLLDAKRRARQRYDQT